MKTLLLILLLVATHTSAFAGEGGSVSGGADYQLDMSAWFTSDDPLASVKICIEADPGFLAQTSLSDNDLSRLTKSSFDQWAGYYQKLGAT